MYISEWLWDPAFVTSRGSVSLLSDTVHGYSLSYVLQSIAMNIVYKIIEIIIFIYVNHYTLNEVLCCVGESV
jgi:hypothetical protein